MKKLLIYLNLLTCFFLTAQEWVNISPFPDSYIRIAGDFISKTEGWIKQSNLAVEPAIYHTSDGGQNWEKIYTLSEPYDRLGMIHMIDSNYGWINVDDENGNCVYLRTVDGGFTWTDMTSYLPVNENDKDYDAIDFINRDVGFICTGVDSLDYSAIIYKTVDGGYNWYMTNTEPIVESGINLVYYPVDYFFIDDTYGWAVCFSFFDTGLLIYTDDGGENWFQGSPQYATLFGVHFIDQNYGGTISCFPTASIAEVMITEDNFKTIKYLHYNWNQYPLDIFFQNDSTVWVTGEPGFINKSIDGGATFEIYQTVNGCLDKIQFFGNTGYIFGDNNSLLKFDGESGIEQEIQVSDCVLHQNYPNPFNPVTEIGFDLTKNADVKLSVYNINGQLLQELVNEVIKAGSYSVEFNGKNLNSGVYYYKLDVNGRSIIKRMVLLK